MLAVDFASDNEIEDGSFWNALAVRRASCFWAKDVPWDAVAPEEGGGEAVESLEKRDWRPVREGFWDVVGEDVLGAVEGDWSCHGFGA